MYSKTPAELISMHNALIIRPEFSLSLDESKLMLIKKVLIARGITSIALLTYKGKL